MSSTDPLAVQLGRFAHEQAQSGLPQELVPDVIDRIVDLVGVALGALGDPTTEAVARTVEGWGGRGGATAFGSGAKLPAPQAALINGALAHALDFDDTHLPSIVHPSSSIIPAALAAAEECSSTPAELIAAVALGLEACVRMGMASYDPQARNHVFFDRGLHATSILGALGSALAAGVLYRLGAEGITHALGVAASMGAGLLEANRTGGTVKRLHNGWAAHAGICAAQLVAAGITGPPTVLEGRFGLFQAFSGDRWWPDPVVDRLGEHWEFRRVFYKPYPTNHFTHAGIDAALELRKQSLNLSDIVSIELGVPEPTLRTIAEPVAEKAAPPTPYAAKFSGPFTVAAALVGGGGLGVGHDDFTSETVTDPERLRLARMVTSTADPTSSDRFPLAFGGVLRLNMSNGTTLEHRIEESRGGQLHPLSRKDLDLKFLGNASRTFGNGRARDILDSLRALAQATHVLPVVAFMVSQR